MVARPVLKVQNLRIELTTRSGVVPVIDDLSFELAQNETLSFVGESGCGKSMTALGIMGLLPEGVGRIAAGSIEFDGEELSTASDARLREIRGNDISMIFQEPMTSLNPVYTAGEQIAEVLRLHQNMSKRAAWSRAVELLDAVRIPDPARRAKAYPFQMSGGQRQRVMIAMALACDPKVLIADEPTTALDVTVQAEIFELLRDLRRQTGTAIILITHDMGAVAQMAERVIVMYAGRRAEVGTVRQIVRSPGHPYTKGLISCVPHIQPQLEDKIKREILTEIPGIVPPIQAFGKNQCLFASRCDFQQPSCWEERPDAVRLSENNEVAHEVDCWRAEEL